MARRVGSANDLKRMAWGSGMTIDNPLAIDQINNRADI
jgi:hypothetical protein